MSHDVGLEDEFYKRLRALDGELVNDMQGRGCPLCGGRLDRADFPRKPRGIPEHAESSFEKRFGLCCAREGCRRRALPPSVRFLGRKVYAAATIVAACLAEVAYQCWQRARRVARWLLWWREVFGRSRAFTALRGHLAGPVEVTALPTALFDRLEATDDRERLVRFLVLVAGPVRELAHEGRGRVAGTQSMVPPGGSALT